VSGHLKGPYNAAVCSFKNAGLGGYPTVMYMMMEGKFFVHQSSLIFEDDNAEVPMPGSTVLHVEADGLMSRDQVKDLVKSLNQWICEGELGATDDMRGGVA